MNLSDAFDNFLVQQKAIMADYKSALQSVTADREFVLSQAVRNARGLSVIDQGNLLGRATQVSTLSDFTSQFVGAISNNIGGGLKVLRLDLQGARKLRIDCQFFLDTVTSGIIGIFVYLSNEVSANPSILDFAILTKNSYGMAVDSTLNYPDNFNVSMTGEIDCATAKFAYFVFPVVEDNNGDVSDGFIFTDNMISTYFLLG